MAHTVGSNVGSYHNILPLYCHSQCLCKDMANLRRQLTCPFCEEIFTSPYMCGPQRVANPMHAMLIIYFNSLLECRHTFCLLCIAVELDDETRYPAPHRFRCPTCGRQITVRPRRNRAVQANVFWLHGAEGRHVSLRICRFSLDVLDEHFPRNT